MHLRIRLSEAPVGREDNLRFFELVLFNYIYVRGDDFGLDG